MRIRRTVYWRFDQPVTLPYVSCLADVHPALIDDAPPPQRAPKPKAERGPAMTEGNIRRVLGRPRRASVQELQAERIFARIEREGA